MTVKTALQIAADIKARRMTAQAVVSAALARIAAANPRVNAFTNVTGTRALARADDIDRRVAVLETLVRELER